MILSNSIKARFIKDFIIPFQVVQEPIFSYTIEEIDKFFQTKSKLKMLTDVVETLGTEEDFFTESNKVKHKIISAIQEQKAYKQLQNDKLEKYNFSSQGVKQQDIYNMENVNRTFISLDLKQANFNVMKMYDPSLTLGFDTYEDLVGSVTDFDYFKKSKYLRQVIFGNMLPKKQQKLQKYVMDKIITMLHQDVGIAMEDFVSSSADEVLVVIDPLNSDKFVEMIENKLIHSDITSEFANWVRVETFTLKSIEDKKYFVKEISNGDIVFKGCPSFFFMQLYKKYTHQPITDIDKTFFHEGHLATFKTGLFDA